MHWSQPLTHAMARCEVGFFWKNANDGPEIGCFDKGGCVLWPCLDLKQISAIHSRMRQLRCDSILVSTRCFIYLSQTPFTNGD